jgi:hypothetical protein
MQTPQTVMGQVFQNNAYANNNGAQVAGSLPVLGDNPGIFNNGMYAFNGPGAMAQADSWKAALASRPSRAIFDNQIVAVNTAAPTYTNTTPTSNYTTTTPPVQTTPWIGTEGGFTGQYYGTTAQPLNWMIQPGGTYVETHGAVQGNKTLAEIAALQGQSQVYVGMDLVSLGQAYQHYNQPTPLQAYQQQLQSQQQPSQQVFGGGPVGGTYTPGMPAVYGNAFDQQLYDYDPNRSAMQNELQGIMNDRAYNPSAYSSGYATLGNTGQSDSNMNLYGAIIGAANSAGNMINTAFGGSPSMGSAGSYSVSDAAFRSTLTSPSKGANMDITLQNYQGTPYYQLNNGASINIPSNVQAELTKQQAYIQAQKNGTMSAYMGQYGQAPNTMAITSYIRNPPPELQEAARQYALQANAANAQARLAVNPNDPIGNAIISNKHISNQALNQSGAGSTILWPDGDQKGRLLRSIPGVTVDPALLAWADTADYLTNQLYPQGIQAGAISPSYQSEGMGTASAAGGWVNTGNGPGGNVWTGTAPRMVLDGGQWVSLANQNQNSSPLWGQQNSGLPEWLQPNPTPFRNNPGGALLSQGAPTVAQAQQQVSAQLLPQGYGAQTQPALYTPPTQVPSYVTGAGIPGMQGYGGGGTGYQTGQLDLSSQDIWLPNDQYGNPMSYEVGTIEAQLRAARNSAYLHGFPAMGDATQ